MGIVCVYLAEILLELTLGPISTVATNKLFRERSPFPRAGHTDTNVYLASWASREDLLCPRGFYMIIEPLGLQELHCVSLTLLRHSACALN